jgi:hypothetical protein
MRRLLLYSSAIVIAAVTGTLAWVLSEARLAFITLGLAIAAGLVWVARRYPNVKRSHLLGAAVVTCLGSIALAILLPSTRSFCDCPRPRDAIGTYACNCAFDHHVSVRIAIALVGGVVACFLVAVAKHRAAQARPIPTAGPP